MLRSIVSKTLQAARFRSPIVSQWTVRQFSSEEESPEEFDKRFVDFFSRPDLDGWLLRKGLTELHHADCVPEPPIVSAALRACRRVNDYALAVRFLEAIKLKCGPKAGEIYPYIIQEVKPVLDELGITTPEELGYDKPEFACLNTDYYIPPEKL